MPSTPTILLIVSIPAGILGYILGVRLIAALPLAPSVQQVLAMIVPLFIAGLCMLPFIIPFFDRMAKRDLAAHQEGTGSTADETGDVQDREQG